MEVSRASLEAMREDAFRLHLIDLYRKMGYHDVDHYHGPRELGKDIIMWHDVAGQRVNVAVVVKAGSITGTAAPKKGSAGEVFNQVTQAFGAPGVDIHLGHFKTDQVYVVCNGEISSSARESLKSMFAGSPRSESIEFFGLERILKLTREHFGVRALIGDVLGANRRLSELGGNQYRVSVEAKGRGTRVSIYERYPGASAHDPITGTLTARFPTTELGLERMSQFQAALQGHTEITLSSDELVDFEMTGALKELIHAMREGTAPRSMTISPTLVQHGKFRGAVRFAPTPGTSLERNISGLDFSTTSRGQTVYLTAVGGPFKFVFTFSIVAGAISKADFSLEFEMEGATPRQFLDWLELFEAVAAGGVFHFLDYDSGNEGQLGPLPAEDDRAPSSWLMKFSRDLLEIQQKGRLNIRLGKEIDRRDVNIASEVAALLNNRNPYTPELRFDASADGVETTLKFPWPAAMSFWTNERRIDLMGASYTLPPMVTHISRLMLSEAESERLLAMVEMPKGDETVSIAFDVEGESNFHFKGLSNGYDEEPDGKSATLEQQAQVLT